MSGSSEGTLPPDDLDRRLVHARPDAGLRHISIAGNTYTFLVTGADTAGRYSLIDMHVPPGGGPPPHRHDFEEMFTLLEGALEFTFRGQTTIVRAGETINVPANAPHYFRNTFDTPARMLCLVSPAGQEEFFAAVGDPVPSRTAPPPDLTEAEQEERRNRARELAPRFRTELL